MKHSRTIWSSVVVVVLVGALAGSALAHDHEPPSARLTAGDKHQRGNIVRFCWVHAAGDPGFFLFYCSDGFYVWPKPRFVPAGTEASIRFGAAHPPTAVQLAYWRRVDDFDNPKGDPTFIESEVVPVMENGEVVAYDAVFTVPGRGRCYVAAFATWPDLEGTQLMQDAAWTFRLKIT